MVVIIGTGLLLLLKKEISWIQPPTIKTQSAPPSISFQEILHSAREVPEAQIRSYDDIDRLDVRPAKGVIKVQAVNGWEVQLDAGSGAVLQSAYRRSDTIESIHDGSLFHKQAKLWLFLPAALILLVLLLSGLYMFVLPLLAKRRKRRRLAGSGATRSPPIGSYAKGQLATLEEQSRNDT